jgi:hypothetical protein
MATLDLGPGIGDVGKDTRWATEHIIFQFNPRIDRNIILDFNIVTNDNLAGDKDILAQVTILSDTRPGPMADGLST